MGTILGISKPCCPVCHCLLNLLSELHAELKPFITRGAHNEFFACSLPTSLPCTVVDRLNEIFGQRLHGELKKFMTDSAWMRERTASTTSSKLSLGTVEEPEYQDRPDLRHVWRDITGSSVASDAASGVVPAVASSAVLGIN